MSFHAIFVYPVDSTELSKQLYNNLTRGYLPNFRPSAGQNNQMSTVKVGLRLSQIISMDEKGQILTLSVWLRQEWHDSRLEWDPDSYGGVKVLHIPSEEIWIPDLALYNNADGDFQITLKTKAFVYYSGTVVWEPPAIYKSYCPIDMEFFPFDVQQCFLKFSSWSYHGLDVDLHHFCNGSFFQHDGPGPDLVIPRGIDLTEYNYNVEWDILNVTAMRRVKYYSCCPEPYPDITFNLTLRRRPLFYTLNLIMPCVTISCLAILVFYLPSDSGEKINLSITILLTLTVFLLLLSDINPPTSLVIPLIGKFLLFIILVVTMSIVLTVYTLHINFKSPTTHKMSPWVKRIFTDIMPKMLFMKRPEPHPSSSTTSSKVSARTENDFAFFQDKMDQAELSDYPSSQYPPEVLEAIKGVTFIANHLRQGDEDLAEERDWKYIATVMDRLFLFIFTSACICATLIMFLRAPSLYDSREHMSLKDPNNACFF